MRAVIFMVVLTFLSGGVSAAVRTWVATNAVDNAECSRSQPCRTFDAAVAAVDAGGEVVVLESGGYGPVTVTKSVSLISPPGIHAAIAPTSLAAVTINGSIRVVLRGLYLNGQGSNTGINVASGDVIHLEDMVVSGFAGNGIEVFGGARVYVKNAMIRQNSGSGIIATPPGPAAAIVDVVGARFTANGFGIMVDSGVQLTVRDSSIVGSGNDGINLRNIGTNPDAKAYVEDTIVSGSNSNGFFVNGSAQMTLVRATALRNLIIGFYANNGGVIVMDQCTATENSAGMLVNQPSDATVSNSLIARNNSSGISQTGGTLRLFGNTVTKNFTGLSLTGGSQSSGGHNFVFGNSTDTNIPGTLTNVPTI